MELVVVLAIMGTILGLASMGTDTIRKERVASAARELYADIQKATLDAMTQDGKGFGIRLESHNSYVIFKFNDCNNDYNYDVATCAGNAKEESGAIRRTLPASVLLHKTNPHADVNNDVRIFDRFGSPRWPTWRLGGITITLKDISDSGAIKCVVISDNRIREAVWNGTSCF